MKLVYKGIFAIIVFFICLSSSTADEIMSCKINDEQSSSYKLQDNLFSEDKIFIKVGVEWIRQCPCEKVKNKSITCDFKQNINQCKKKYFMMKNLLTLY